MQAIVKHDVLGATALFGAIDVPITDTEGVYALASEASLAAPDFTLAIAALGTLPATLPATLALIGTAQLPFDLPPLLADLRYQIKDGQFVLEHLDNLSIALAGNADAATVFRLQPSTLSVSVGVEGWKAKLVAQDPAQPHVASVHLGEIEFDITQLEFAATGVTACTASLQPRNVNFAGRPIELLGGNLTVLGKRISATVEARLSVEGLQNSHIDLTITASGEGGAWQLNAVARTPTIDAWRDPSGYLLFENMSISWLLAYQAGAISGTLSASGRVQFLGDKLSASAKEWLGELFGGLSADFTDVRLGAWDSPDFLKFRPISSLEIKALDIFDLRIPSIGISSAGIELEDLSLAVHAGGASIQATLPKLAIRLTGDAIDLAISADKLRLDVALTVPGGIKAHGFLEYTETPELQQLSGEARFSTPTLPGVDVMFKIGRMRFEENGAWEPLLLLYADVPVTIPVFPGIVIQRLALGAGLNFAVDGVTGLSFAEAQRKVGGGGLPDVSREKSWVPRAGAFTLAARAFMGPNAGYNEAAVQLYVADLTFVMAENLQLAAYLKVWFQTSLADAREARFQHQPAVVALATFDGNEPSLRLIAMSKSDALSSLAESGESGGLLSFKLPETRLAFEANARGMAIVIGPNTLSGSIGPLQLSARTMLAVRAMDGEVMVVYRNALEAGFHVEGGLDLGLVRFSASVTAAFSAQLELWGLCESDGKLTVYGDARARFLVDVALHVRIGFRIEISYGFGSIEIECYQHWDFGLRVHIDLSLAVAMSTHAAPGVEGRGTIGVDVLGMSVSVSLPLELNSGAVRAARATYANKIEPRLNALGAN